MRHLRVFGSFFKPCSVCLRKKFKVSRSTFALDINRGGCKLIELCPKTNLEGSELIVSAPECFWVLLLRMLNIFIPCDDFKYCSKLMMLILQISLYLQDLVATEQAYRRTKLPSRKAWRILPGYQAATYLKRFYVRYFVRQ